MADALHIDNCIAEYNATIEKLVAQYDAQHGNQKRYRTVPIAKALRELAWKRNAGQPTYQMPPELKSLDPQVNTKMYHADEQGRLRQGGIFSLDGVHPTAIGQGLVAYEFLKVMKDAGIVGDTALEATHSTQRRSRLCTNSTNTQCLRRISSSF